MPENVQTGLRLKIRDPQGRVYERSLEGACMILGRDPRASICLDHPSVSRRHCEIRMQTNGALLVRDLGSTNGTALNGMLITESALHPGDVLQLGDMRVMLEREAPPQPEIPTAPLEEPSEEDHLDVVESLEPVASSSPFAAEWTAAQQEEDESEATAISGVLQSGASQARRYKSAFATLFEVAKVSARLTHLEAGREFYDQVLETLRKAFPKADNIAVLKRSLSDRDTGGWGEATRHGMEVVAQEFFVTPEGSSAGPSRAAIQALARSRRALYAVDVQKDPRFANSESVRSRHLRSIMCVPLTSVEDHLLGALYVESVTNPFCFDTFDLKLLSAFAIHVATAMENHRRYELLDRAYAKSHLEAQEALRDKVALTLAVRQSEKKFRALFEQNALGAALIHVRTGVIQEANEGLARLTGFSRRELTGRPFRDLFPSPEALAIQDWVRLVLQKNEASAETRLRHADGGAVTVIQSSRVFSFNEENYILTNFLNIMQRKQAEQEVKTQLRRISTLQEFSQACASTLEPTRLYRLIYEKVRSVIPTDAFLISLLTRGGEGLRAVFAVDIIDGQPQIVIDREVTPADRPVMSQIVQKREPLLILRKPEDLADPPLRTFGSAQRSASLIFVPMVAGDTVIGLISTQSYTPNAYDSSQSDLLHSLATQAAMAIQNARLFDSIRRQREELQQLSNRILQAQEQERGRIARELHDGIGQVLTGLRMQLQSMTQPGRPDDSAIRRSALHDALELSSRAIEDLRNIALDLRPSMLDDLGLVPTLEWFCSEFSRRHGIKVEFHCDLNEEKLPDDLESALYRIVQEGLGNILKHAKATEAEVTLESDERAIRLTVRDNGKGFDPNDLPAWQSQRHCSGILNMKERASMVGGSMNLQSAPGAGTVLLFEIPLSGRAHPWRKPAQKSGS